MINALASIPPSPQSYFEIGNFQIRYYAMMILIGIVVAIWVAAVRLKKRGAESGIALDVAIWAVPLGIIGARVYHVVTHWSDYFGPEKDPISALYVWEGGIAIYGGLIAGAFGAWLAARQDGVRFLAVADAFAPGLLLAQAIGRWGNYFNNELFGIPTDLPWGLAIPSYNAAYPQGLPDGVLFHPTFLYESIWNVTGALVLLWAERKFRLQWGRVFALYLVIYSLGRALIESIRIDPSQIYFGIRVNVWTAIAGVIIGLILFIWLGKRHVGVEASIYLPNRGPEEDAERIAAKKSARKSVNENEADEVNSKAKTTAKKAKETSQ